MHIVKKIIKFILKMKDKNYCPTNQGLVIILFNLFWQLNFIEDLENYLQFGFKNIFIHSSVAKFITTYAHVKYFIIFIKIERNYLIIKLLKIFFWREK